MRSWGMGGLRGSPERDVRPAGTLRLTRDVHVAQVFLSFGAWESIDAVRAWKSAPDFRERMSRMLQHVDEFESSELALVATAEAGAASAEPSPVRLESSARGVTDQRQGCSV